jgi:hypothetical protein
MDSGWIDREELLGLGVRDCVATAKAAQMPTEGNWAIHDEWARSFVSIRQTLMRFYGLYRIE